MACAAESLAPPSTLCTPACALQQGEEVEDELVDAFVASLNHHGIKLEVVELDDKGGRSRAQQDTAWQLMHSMVLCYMSGG